MPDIAKLAVVVTADTSDAEKGLKSVSAGIGTFATGAAAALTAAGVGIVAAGGYAVKAATDFEQTMSGVKAVSGATAAEMKGLQGLALQLGKDTSFSASEAAAGIEELVKGGLTIPDIMNGAAKATLDLAAAGGVSLPDAATIAANALAQFNLKGQDMAHVADLIAGAANASALDVGQFKFSLQAAGAVAATTGFSFDDLAQAIAVMGKAGITGSDAGTSLKTMMLNLQPTTKKAKATMQDLGLWTAQTGSAFFDATGKVKPMAEVAGLLEKATRDLTQAQKLQALETIFGSDAIRAAAVLAKEGAGGFNEMATSMGKVTAASVGAEKLNNLAGDITTLKGSVETAAITFGMAFLPVLRDATQWATNLVNGMIPWIERVGPQVVQTLQQIGAAFGDLVRSGDVGVFADDLREAFGIDITPLVKAVQVVQGVVEAIGRGFREGGLLGAFAAWLGEARKFGAAVLDWIGDQVNPILTKLSEWADAFVAWVAPLVDPFLRAVGGLLGQLGTWITDTAAPAILGKLGSWKDQFVAWIGPATEAFLAAWPANLTRFLDWLEFTAAPAIADTLQSWGRSFVAWVGGEGEGGAAGNLLTALGNIASVLFRFVASTAEVLGPRLLAWSGKFLGWVATDVLPFLAAQLGRMLVAIGNWLVTDAIPWAGTAFVALGKAIVGGIVQGILSAPGAIVDAIKSLVPPAFAAPVATPAPNYGAVPPQWRPPVNVGGATGYVNGVPIRDAGGPGRPGTAYAIGTGAQPELFVPDRPGRFYPSGSYGGGPTTADVTLVLDRQVLARVNARLDERNSKRGGR